MGTQSRVGRPRKRTRRVELRLNADDTATKRLIAEADQRGVALQQHIVDILAARYLGGGSAPAPEPIAATDAPSALAEEWM
jgi:hypothetical protein